MVKDDFIRAFFIRMSVLKRKGVGMAIIEAVILLITLVIIANIIGHYLPNLPVSLI